MAAPTVGPCAPWIDGDDLAGCTPCRDLNLDAEVADDAAAAASEVLYVLSGRQFPGTCTDTIRPCRQPSVVWWWPSWPVDYPPVVYWTDGCECGARDWDRCGCPRRQRISLPGRPVTDVTGVKIDGAAFTDFRVDDYRWLVRTDGDAWPSCQDLLADPDTDDDTFEVTYSYGAAVPTLGTIAARRLACELYRACIGSDCDLPQRVQTITREGVTMAVLDPFDFLEAGKTGLYDVDLFLRTYNPAGRRRRAAIYSPDVSSTATRVDTGG